MAYLAPARQTGCAKISENFSKIFLTYKYDSVQLASNSNKNQAPRIPNNHNSMKRTAPFCPFFIHLARKVPKTSFLTRFQLFEITLTALVTTIFFVDKIVASVQYSGKFQSLMGSLVRLCCIIPGLEAFIVFSYKASLGQQGGNR